MNTLIEKIKVIYIPFVLIFIGFISLYTFLHWFLVIDKGLFNLRAETLNLWLPLLLPIIPIFILLRPRIHLLNFKKDDYHFWYQFLALSAISITTIITQEYLVKATGKLTQLENISQIKEKPKTKYYQLNQYYFDKKNAVPYGTYDVSGKYNEDMNFHIYCILPIVKDSFYPSDSTCSAWLGTKKNKTVSNRLDDNEQKIIYDEFYKKTWDKFNDEDLTKFVYLERITEKDLGDYQEAVRRSSRPNSGEIVVLKAINEPFESRTEETSKWIFLSFIIGVSAWLILLFFPSINISNLAEFKKNGRLPSNKSGMAEIFDLFIPKEGFFITPIIANLNILIYLIMAICGLGFMSFKGNDLLNWGANFRPLVLEGEWWRLLSSTFLHGSIMHISSNMCGLVIVGLFLEPTLGRRKYLLVYMTTGILASLSSIWWYEATVSVGASGAIFGLYGVFLSLLLMNIFPREMKGGFLLSTSIFVGYNLLMGLTGGIDNAAHIGGLISGLIIGFIICPFLKNQSKYWG